MGLRKPLGLCHPRTCFDGQVIGRSLYLIFVGKILGGCYTYDIERIKLDEWERINGRIFEKEILK
jgi:hypothetical protein